MAIEFTELAEPQTLTTALSIILSTIIIFFGFIAYRFRSPVIFFVWMIMIFVLLFTFLTQLSFVWFWLMVGITALTIVIAVIIRELV